MKMEFYYLSKDGVTNIHAFEWIPQGEVKAVLQICHGMVEYIDRYHEFADFLCSQGFYVVGHDHLGHGKSIASEKNLGFFHEKNGNEFVISDIHKLHEMTLEKYPDVPYFIMGHSMGSFLVRQYLGTYENNFAGAIIMGTGSQPSALLMAGKLMCRSIALFRGWKYKSKLIDGMAAGGYAKHFKEEANTSSWIAKNPEVVEKYGNDPLCGYMFTVNGYYHMFSGMKKMNALEKKGSIRKDLPVFFVAGKEDPVGDFGVSVEKVYRKYQDSGIADVSMKLYEGDRHEILNECDKAKVYEDLLVWMNERMEI